jgi:hypothetical protein
LKRKTHPATKAHDTTDPEELHMMDETNTEWVKEWKKASKTKSK